jgi:hypothetical protein
MRRAEMVFTARRGQHRKTAPAGVSGEENVNNCWASGPLGLAPVTFTATCGSLSSVAALSGFNCGEGQKPGIRPRAALSCFGKGSLSVRGCFAQATIRQN